MPETVIRGITVRCLPTPEQERIFKLSAWARRFTYNKYIEFRDASYKRWVDAGKDETKAPKPLTCSDFRKFMTVVRNQEEGYLSHLREVSANVIKIAAKDADAAYQKWFRGQGKHPRFKKKSDLDQSFYVNYSTLSWRRNGFRGERLGEVRTTKPLPKLPKGKKYSNPHIFYDGFYWNLAVGVPKEVKAEKTDGETVGIDVGIHTTAATSYEEYYPNINKTPHVRKLEKRLHRLERHYSKLMEANIDHYETGPKGGRVPVFKKPMDECKNIQKLGMEIRKAHKRINDYKATERHRMTRELVSRPETKTIVIEDLNVSGMMSNRYRAKATQNQSFYEIRRQIEYKSEEEGVGVIVANRWFPSSKICSNCGHVHKQLKKDDRVFVCPVCGATFDRDLNAAINLANYLPESHRKVKPVKGVMATGVGETDSKHVGNVSETELH